MSPVSIRFLLLGPLEVRAGGRTVALTGRQRGLLAAVLVDAGQVVPVPRIIDRLWGEGAAPRTAPARVRALVTEVRRALGTQGPELLITRNPGYLMRVEPGQSDVDEFISHVEEARHANRSGRPLDAFLAYDRAMALWRGTPLGDLTGLDAQSHLGRLEGLRTTAAEGKAEAALATGRGEAAVADLRALLDEHPFRERQAGLLMQALALSGRRAEALQVYKEIRYRLEDELGVEPSAELRGIHRRVLEGDGPTGAVPTQAPPERPAASAPPPRQLPAVTTRFTGRTGELRRLDDLHAAGERAALVVGPAGVGKTTLAVHWAHRMTRSFPDGHLFLNLRGFDRAGPMMMQEAVPLLLQALGHSARDIPVDLDAQLGLYRSLLANRRALLVLDDVADSTLPRGLLPGESNCMVVMTSRNRLPGLVAMDGVPRIDLDVFGRDEALDLLTGAVGPGRVQAEPEATDELVDLCDRLPLALCVAMSWIADHDQRTIAQHVAELIERGRLTRLRVDGEPLSVVQAALDLSYEALPAPVRRTFRMLSLVPHAGMPVAAGAALAGTSAAETADHLDAMARIHLLRETAGRRFSGHGLVVEHAAQRSALEDTPAERETAVSRLMDHLLHSVVNAARASGFRSHLLAYKVSGTQEAREAVSFTTDTAAKDWFDEEWENIALAVSHAAERGPALYAPLLVFAMNDLLHHCRSYPEWLRVAGVALESARRHGDLVGQAAMHISLGLVRWRMADLRNALAENELGLELARRAGWRHGEAMALQGCGVTLKQLGSTRHAVARYSSAARIHRAVGDSVGEARCLNNMASAHLITGRLDKAEAYLTANLKVVHRAGDEHLRALTLVNLGIVHQQQGRFPEALTALNLALETVAGRLPYAEAVAHEAIGWVLGDTGRTDEAVASFDEALRIARQVENRTCQVDSLAGMANALLYGGRLDHAMARLDTAREIAEGTDVSLIGVSLVAAEAERRLGRHARAREEAEHALALAAVRSPLDLARLYHLCARICLDTDDAPGAAQACRQALRLARRAGQALEHALVQITLGHARRKLGGEHAARATWGRAHSALVALEAPHQRETAALLQ
ncbi:BTAD domain-containing putative transcriptional regulator [Streptomyces sp. NPDC057429]|uniref:AfsR/SARP family transcriptional regulator n=1 Tax=Streptomyces sp. NPDC057429 TaxID=3346130 RepID=UPI0036ACDCE4